ncbi:hypothetical protein V6N11_057967 [Hibiscus sabdariffa]
MWGLWLNRNVTLFYPYREEYESILERSSWLVVEMVASRDHRLSRMFANRRRSISNTRWQAPLTDWVKLNLDGSCRVDCGGAICGEVLRNENDEWIVDFM